MGELARMHGTELLLALFDELLDRAETMTTQALRGLRRVCIVMPIILIMTASNWIAACGSRSR